MSKRILSHERLCHLLGYDQETGVFTWINKPSKFGHMKAGMVAGNISPTGYRSIRVDGALYYEHRLAFLYMTGSFPVHSVDHINHNSQDNRWINLRDVDHTQNMRNQLLRSKKATGIIYIQSTNRWRAYIGIDSKFKHIGCYESLFEAACARKSAEIKHGYHENHGNKMATSQSAGSMAADGRA